MFGIVRLKLAQVVLVERGHWQTSSRLKYDKAGDEAVRHQGVQEHER